MTVFVEVVEKGSVPAAAKALGISEHVANQHVMRLEAMLGTEVLDRATGSQTLTDMGRLFYERCKVTLAESDSTEDAEAGAPSGRLCIAAPVIFGTFGLTPVLASFLARFPEVQVELMLTDRSVDLVNEGFEAAIRLGPPTDSSLTALELAPYPMVVCASPDYLARRGRPASPQDLAGHTCLCFDECLGQLFPKQSPPRDWGLRAKAQIHTVRIDGRLCANDMRALIEAAAHGAGILLAPELAVADELAAGRLKRVLAEFDAPSQSIHVAFGAQPLTPRLSTFIHELMAAFSPIAQTNGDSPAALIDPPDGSS